MALAAATGSVAPMPTSSSAYRSRFAKEPCSVARSTTIWRLATMSRHGGAGLDQQKRRQHEESGRGCCPHRDQGHRDVAASLAPSRVDHRRNQRHHEEHAVVVRGPRDAACHGGDAEIAGRHTARRSAFRPAAGEPPQRDHDGQRRGHVVLHVVGVHHGQRRHRQQRRGGKARRRVKQRAAQQAVTRCRARRRPRPARARPGRCSTGRRRSAAERR